MVVWRKHVASRLMAPAEVLARIAGARTVMLSMGAAFPLTVAEELCRWPAGPEPVKIVAGAVAGSFRYATADCARVFSPVFILGGPHREVTEAFEAGRADYWPTTMTGLNRALEQGTLSVDVAVIQVSEPDRAGYCSLGASVDCAKTVVRVAGTVVAEVNRAAPRTCGDTLVHVSEIDYFVEARHPLIEFPAREPDAVEQAIGANVAELVPDGAVLQIGIGRLADAILGALRSKRDLSVWSGIVSDVMIDLREEGVITNRNNLLPGHMVATWLLGTRDGIYSFAHANDAVLLFPTEVVHNARYMGRLKNFVAINAAVEVDLMGQVNCEYAGERLVGGIGGGLDFVRGALASPGGRVIFALPSTTQGDRASRIKAAVGSVSIPKTDVDFVVTEHGVADLRGKGLRERIREMVNVAHPLFRDELREAGERLLRFQKN